MNLFVLMGAGISAESGLGVFRGEGAYPAVGLAREARARGLRCCELNLEPSDNAVEFDDRRYGPASEIVPSWVEEMLAS
jgi:NAD-dependent deacetylase